MNDNISDFQIDKATRYLEIAKTCQEQLWKRRHIEWRTGFSLWAAIAIGAGFIYKTAHRPLPDIANWIVFVLLPIIFATIIYIHHRHIRAIFISNERDLQFLNYYTNRAAWELCDNDLKKPNRPKWSEKSDREWSTIEEENKFFEEHKDKMRHRNTQVAITSLIAVLSWGLLILMCFENR